jgi:hypothetical protein
MTLKMIPVLFNPAKISDTYKLHCETISKALQLKVAVSTGL